MQIQFQNAHSHSSPVIKIIIMGIVVNGHNKQKIVVKVFNILSLSFIINPDLSPKYSCSRNTDSSLFSLMPPYIVGLLQYWEKFPPPKNTTDHWTMRYHTKSAFVHQLFQILRSTCRLISPVRSRSIDTTALVSEKPKIYKWVLKYLWS